MSFTITHAQADGDLAGVAEMTRRYLEWDIQEFQAASGLALNVEDDLSNTLENRDAYMPPEGRLLMARDADGSLLGLVLLKPLTAQAGELKRLFVDEKARGRGAGRALIDDLLKHARDIGYAHLFLDTATYMQAAHRLYRSTGFRDCAPYPGSENDESLQAYLIFMRLDLNPANAS